jgi:CRISPR-associated protein Cas2
MPRASRKGKRQCRSSAQVPNRSLHQARPLTQQLGHYFPTQQQPIASESVSSATMPEPPLPASKIPEGWWEAAFSNQPTPSERRGHKCGEHQMLTVVAYDITDDRRLRKIAKVCEDHGVRVQYSVFECRLDADRFDAFWNDLLGVIDPETDRIVAYKVCSGCAKDIRDAGIQTHYEKFIAYVF